MFWGAGATQGEAPGQLPAPRDPEEGTALQNAGTLLIDFFSGVEVELGNPQLKSWENVGKCGKIIQIIWEILLGKYMEATKFAGQILEPRMKYGGCFSGVQGVQTGISSGEKEWHISKQRNTQTWRTRQKYIVFHTYISLPEAMSHLTFSVR